MALTPERIKEIKQELEELAPEEQQKRLQELLATLSPEEREQLAGKPQCPFCMIADGKIPATKVYEDAEILAVLDINPATPGHTIAFTKEHYAKLEELSADETQKLFKTAQKAAKAMTSGLNAAGVNIYLASGQTAGQTAPHLLVNIIPRYENDGVRFGWQPKKQTDEELENIGKRISENLEKEKPTVAITEVVTEDDDDFITA